MKAGLYSLIRSISSSVGAANRFGDRITKAQEANAGPALHRWRVGRANPANEWVVAVFVKGLGNHRPPLP